MEMRFLSKDAEITPGNTIRIDTWRNTLQLFHRYNKPKFVGPFYAAGYKNYSLEGTVLGKSSTILPVFVDGNRIDSHHLKSKGPKSTDTQG